MQALVGQEAPFDRGREQLQLLAGLEVTTKSVERTAEAIGADGWDRSSGVEERDGGSARQGGEPTSSYA
jgi:hypothetical protein